MKTSWNELRLIEAYLLDNLPAEDCLLIEARQILQPDFEQHVHWQQKTYELVKQYGRQQLKKEIDQVQEALFTQTQHLSFRQKISRLFRNSKS